MFAFSDAHCTQLRRVSMSSPSLRARLAWHTFSPARMSMAAFGYSAYDRIRKPPKRPVSTPSHSFPTATETSSGIRRRGGDQSGNTRPTQSSSQRHHEAQQMFPETLKSGRYKQQSTRAQRLCEAPSGPSPDTRFYRKLNDYREIQDNDPYASVFGESASVKKRRIREWQRQFEEENADMELPYERTNVLARLAPNWFVRYFVNMRDRGGADHLGGLWVCGFVALSLLWIVGYMFYTPPSKARSISEVR